MGKGVFANQTIPSESIIGEYLGRLHPPKSLPVHDRYVFVIPEIGEVTANQFGNLTRFVNHHCDPNVTARVGMYGKRQVVLYVANREIKAGEQLFVDYGSVYFSLPDYPCRCDAQDGDHVPSAVHVRPRAVAAAESASVKASRLARDARALRRNQQIYKITKEGERNHWQEAEPDTVYCSKYFDKECCCM
ncbi:Histone-lysine N-methyltransferase ehmt1 [Diaporthe eres]|uniref:Histone-lysine N-methyltransferase ehmt1 n=1 Tax=Diaporthe eres TaxID=83184 RepID=A0ABR1NQS6_DIAER